MNYCSGFLQKHVTTELTLSLKSLAIVFLFVFFIIFTGQIHLYGQTTEQRMCTIVSTDGTPISGASLLFVGIDSQLQRGFIANSKGIIILPELPPNRYIITVRAAGYEELRDTIFWKEKNNILKYTLQEKSFLSNEVVIRERGNNLTVGSLRSIDGAGLYEAKKTELIEPEKLAVNRSANTARQIFARIPGVNVWESDAAGIQLGIGTRGLSPNRTANFNTRQNGYDISADALGYPESYYTPPAEAIERIEIVRGAASLQYGPQFGGLLNFVMKKGAEHTALEVTARQTIGSFGFWNTFLSAGGTLGEVQYYGFLQKKEGNGWRPNSGFDVLTGYGSVQWNIAENARLSADVTSMGYVAQQPGGLTDTQFEQDARQSLRQRNWFQVSWNVFSVRGTWDISPELLLDSRLFGVLSARQALGNLERINVVDIGGNRTMIDGQFANWGNETRLIARHAIADMPITSLLGIRIYKGYTTQTQGDANASEGAEFSFLNPNYVEGSDFRFPGENIAIFTEHIFRLSPYFSITPGIRWEYIGTRADGWYRERVKDFAGNIIADRQIFEQRGRFRSFLLAGIGASFMLNEQTELYGNISQNYRSVTFSDLRVDNPNYIVNPDIQDERGYNADVGVRGSWGNVLSFDVSAFYLRYAQRIGFILKADMPPLYLPYRYRTNIADSRSFGLEAVAEIDVLKLIKQDAEETLALFTNISYNDARYLSSADASVHNKEVELSPPYILRGGIRYSSSSLQCSFQYSYTAEHFSDATNAIRTATAVNGIIPAYGVADAFIRWQILPELAIEGSVNNVTNVVFFTRRAEGYPGPGILPSDGRTFYCTAEVRL